jgi:hypothetical protein
MSHFSTGKKPIRQFKLDDGQFITVAELVERTGLPKSTCYSRLIKWTNPEELFKIDKRKKVGGLQLYILDDGSEWTSKSLAEHLKCKPSTASTRLSMMKGNSKKILAPVRKQLSDDDAYENKKEVEQYVEQRMLWDKQGHWKLLNANT